MSHPFGDLISQHLHRKPGLTQLTLAAGIGQPRSVVGLMCKGQRLTGPQARDRVVAVIAWLQRQDVLTTRAEADTLLKAAGMAGLNAARREEAALIAALENDTPIPIPIPIPIEPISRLPSSGRANKLPIPLNTFVGRNREIAEVIQGLSNRTTRLLTLSGPGGGGKTRLAVQVLLRMENVYPYGIYWVELAAIGETGRVTRAVATAFGMSEQAELGLVETIASYLQHKRLLLVLDNCEHLIAECAGLVGRLLYLCPDLQVLATSREELDIPGEIVYLVPPLALPAQKAPLPFDAIASSEAIQLFVVRAKSEQPGFALTAINGPIILQICRQLDGIPLAIELAAARTKLLSAKQIADRLDDRFRLLSGGNRTALPRQQTLRATIDWSYSLLAESEQRLLRRLAVFSGGFSLEAVEAICGGAGNGETDVFELLAQLIDKSLVMIEDSQGQAARYRLLETIRQYAAEKLRESGELACIQQQHYDWYLSLVQQGTNVGASDRVLEWMAAMRIELANLEAALAWAQETNMERALALAAAMELYWEESGSWSEGMRRLEQILANCSGVRAELLAPVYYQAAKLAWRWRALDRMRTYAEQSLSLFRASGDKAGIAGTLLLLGIYAQRKRNYAQAGELGEESLALYRQMNDEHGIAVGLIHLSWVAFNQGDAALAEQLLAESLATWRETGNRQGVARVLNDMGEQARARGDFATAYIRYEESLAIYRALSRQGWIAGMLHNLGHAALGLDRIADAAACFRESLQLYRSLGEDGGVASCIAGLGGIAAREGRTQQAIRLLGAAAALNEQLHITMDPVDQAEFDNHTALARVQSEDATWQMLWNQARALSFEEVEQIIEAVKAE